MSDGTSRPPQNPEDPEEPQNPYRQAPPPAGGSYGQAPPPPEGEPYGGYQSMPGVSGGPAQPPAEVPQPSSITNAVKLMYAGAAISLIGLIVSLFSTGDMRTSAREALRKQGKAIDESTVDTAVTFGIIFGVVLGLVGVGLWLWMAKKNGAGRSWARIVATVLGGLNILLTVVGLSQSTATGFSTVLNIISVLLAIVILVLLWRKESSQFYTARSAPSH